MLSETDVRGQSTGLVWITGTAVSSLVASLHGLTSNITISAININMNAYMVKIPVIVLGTLRLGPASNGGFREGPAGSEAGSSDDGLSGDFRMENLI